MSTKKPASEEEIELGNLFLVIGKGISNFFKFLGNILASLYQLFIDLLLFVRKHFLKLAISAIIGLVIGYFLEGNKATYQSNLIVEPNFSSTLQLYKNIEGYNELIQQKDSIKLSEIFNLTVDEAKSLKSIEIEPIITESDQIKIFDEFIIKADTTTIKNIVFDKFIKNLSQENYSNHIIYAKASDKFVFKKLEPIIINSIISNKHFTRLKNAFEDNSLLTEKTLLNEQLELDSLRNIYNQVLLKEADNEASGTNIDLGSRITKKEKELELFDINLRLNEKLVDLKIENTEKKEIVNVLSGFSGIGTKMSFATRTPITLALLLSSLTFVILLLIKFNKYLNKF